MKTRLLVAAFSCAIIYSQAQITLSHNDMPQAGDSIRISFALGTTVNYMNTGANMLWDFSSLIPNAQQMIRYDAPSSLPFNIISTECTSNPSPDSLPGIGTIPSDFTNYYKLGNSSYKQNGISFIYSAIINYPIPVLYNNADYIYRFPLAYGNVDSCHADYNFSIPNLAYIGQDIHRVNEVDGWGALITPYGIFNTIRVKSVLDRTDTISLDTLGFGFSIPRPTQIQYKWLAAGMKIPVLEIDADIILNNEIVSNIAYQDSLRDSLFQVGIPEMNIQNIAGFTVFPNPASENCSVYYDLSNSGSTQIFLTDLSGRIIKTILKESESSGPHFQQIDLSGISGGIYFLNIISGSAAKTLKVIVEN